MATQITRPPRVPTILRRIARERGCSPAEVLVEAIASHPTYEEAAASLGVPSMTLRRWRRRFAVEVKRVNR